MYNNNAVKYTVEKGCECFFDVGIWTSAIKLAMAMQLLKNGGANFHHCRCSKSGLVTNAVTVR